MDDDIKFLRSAIETAKRSIKEGGGPFGALVVKDGKIISRSGNKVVNSNDPTAHAEVLAIREAACVLKTYDLTGCVLYTSCEPCPMCLGAIYWSRLSGVVYASVRNDAADAGFDDDLIYHEISKDPSLRKISFRLIEDKDAKEVFRIWKSYGDKIPY